MPLHSQPAGESAELAIVGNYTVAGNDTRQRVSSQSLPHCPRSVLPNMPSGRPASDDDAAMQQEAALVQKQAALATAAIQMRAEQRSMRRHAAVAVQSRDAAAALLAEKLRKEKVMNAIAQEEKDAELKRLRELLAAQSGKTTEEREGRHAAEDARDDLKGKLEKLTRDHRKLATRFEEQREETAAVETARRELRATFKTKMADLMKRGKEQADAIVDFQLQQQASETEVAHAALQLKIDAAEREAKEIREASTRHKTETMAANSALQEKISSLTSAADATRETMEELQSERDVLAAEKTTLVEEKSMLSKTARMASARATQLSRLVATNASPGGRRR